MSWRSPVVALPHHPAGTQPAARFTPSFEMSFRHTARKTKDAAVAIAHVRSTGFASNEPAATIRAATRASAPETAVSMTGNRLPCKRILEADTSPTCSAVLPLSHFSSFPAHGPSVASAEGDEVHETGRVNGIGTRRPGRKRIDELARAGMDCEEATLTCWVDKTDRGIQSYREGHNDRGFETRKDIGDFAGRRG
jgi:hypothetical protein